MKRVYCSPGAPKIECTDGMTKHVVRWDFQKEQQGEELVYTCMCEEYATRPTIHEIKETIYSWVNQKATKNIVEGFTFDNVRVWLSNENQANYSAIFTILLEDDSILPVTVRGGSNENPQTLVFNTAESFGIFWKAARQYINNIVHAAWEEKDNFDFEEYEQLLTEL